MTESRCSATEDENAYQHGLAEQERMQPEIEEEIKALTDILYEKKMASYTEFNELAVEAFCENPSFIEALRNQVVAESPCDEQIGEQLRNLVTDYIYEVAKGEVESDYS